MLKMSNGKRKKTTIFIRDKSDVKWKTHTACKAKASDN